MKRFLNWLINSEHSEIVGSILVGVGYVALLILVFFVYVSMKGV